MTDTRKERRLRTLRLFLGVAGVTLLLVLAVWAVLYWDEVPALILFGLLLLALARITLRIAARDADG